MFKREAKLNLLIPIVIILTGLIAAFLFFRPHSKDMSETHRIMMENEFTCPNGSKLEIDRWGPAGYMRYCSVKGKKHGKWEAWEYKYKKIDGFYSNDLKDGEWIFWNEDGNKYRVVKYENGKEVSNIVLTES